MRTALDTKNIKWGTYKARTCRVQKNEMCRICGKPIISGEVYLDGGTNLRAHAQCVTKLNNLGTKAKDGPEKTRTKKQKVEEKTKTVSKLKGAKKSKK